MTKSVQKRRERFFAEEAARLLGRAWDLGIDREHPDFVVTEGKGAIWPRSLPNFRWAAGQPRLFFESGRSKHPADGE